MPEALPAAETDLGLWGQRPVRWGMKMLGSDTRVTIASLSPGEIREVAEFLGLDWKGQDEDDERVLADRFARATRLRRIDLASIDAEADPVLRRNLLLLQTTIGLSDLDIDIIMFRAMLRLHPGFEALAGKYIGLCCDFVFHRKLAALFDVSAADVTAALCTRGKLIGSGLVSVHAGILGSLETRLRLMTNLISGLMRPAESAAGLIASLLPRELEANLQLSAYPHLAAEIRLLCDRLYAAYAKHQTGVNVLLHGSPGTGKTELAAALAASLGTALYVCSGVSDGDTSLEPRRRLCEVVELQRLVRIVGAGLILVDEAEDLFPTVWSDSVKIPTKAAVNECLENTPTPTIWISNRTQHMDEAFLRRFDLVIHVTPLPGRAKETLLRESLPADTLEQCELRRYAAQRELSPAMLTRLAQVAISGTDEPSRVHENFSLLSRHYLHSLGAQPLPSPGHTSGLDHDPALLHTDPPLDSLLTGIARAKAGARLLLHGPPGTGKTAFGNALAETLDKPLLQRQASSLLSCYLGETEKNLREMFDEARREEGILLLDEADGFLRSREGAHARWEVTQINEMLTQMEAFEGIFVCTTNRLGDLDPAALRRFDFKVEFRPLRLEQRFTLLRQCCDHLGIRHRIDGEDGLRAILERLFPLEGLTPGDAAAVLRRLRFCGGTPSLDALLDALADECRYKPAAPRPIGFVH